MAEIDKILVSIFQRSFKSITDEMSISLTKTTRSPILCEAKDFVTGLYDAKGQMLEQTENLPILSFSLGPVCKVIIDFFGEEIEPGDVIIHNDVFSMGNQNNDVAIFKPIFYDNILIGWSAAKGHQADIGGAVQGGYNPNATEVWEEALRIPAVKLFEKGKLRKDVWNLIFANIRLQMVQEDIMAQIGACTLGERRLQALVEKYGFETFESHKLELFRSTENMMRAEIRGIPNGVYEGESRVYYEGMLKPLKYIVPVGTILNAAYPKATTFGNHLCPQVADSIFKALSQAIPERVTAGWNHLLCSLFTGLHPRTGRKYVDICFMGLKGGSGALEGDDGYDHIGMIDASGGVLDQDYEMYERQTPHLIIKHEYLTDTAGAGKWRGGLGVETVIQIGAAHTKMVVFGDGDVEPPYGLNGGKQGTLNIITITYPDGKEVIPMSKDLVNDIPKGTIYRQVAGGGGGYGNPEERDKVHVDLDIKNEVVSIDKAKEEYFF